MNNRPAAVGGEFRLYNRGGVDPAKSRLAGSFPAERGGELRTLSAWGFGVFVFRRLGDPLDLTTQCQILGKGKKGG